MPRIFRPVLELHPRTEHGHVDRRQSRPEGVPRLFWLLCITVGPLISGMAVAQGPPAPPGVPAVPAVPVVPAAPGPILPPAATSPLSQTAESLRSRIHDQTVRINTYLKSEDLKRAKDAAEDQDADLNQLNAIDATAQKISTALPTPTTALAAADTSAAKTDAASDVTKAKSQVDAATDRSGCDGKSRLCLFGGALVGSYSLTSGWGDRTGQTGHHIVSLLVPNGGVRLAVREHVSLDLGFYTSIISPQFQANTIDMSGSGCSKTASKFNDLLPCEGNTALRPYAAMLLGATIGTGNSSLGILTVGYTLGIARTTQDANAFWFHGVMIGTAGVYSTVSL